jgi:hypothetical protein
VPKTPCRLDGENVLANMPLLSQGHIRYLLSTGKTEWESMERYIDGL